MEYMIPENMPLKDILDNRVNNYKENNPDKPLKLIFNNLASNWDTYVQILDEAKKSKNGLSKSKSRNSLGELDQFEYIRISNVEDFKGDTYNIDYLTLRERAITDYTITDKGRKELEKIYRNQALINEFLKQYKEY